MADYIITLPEVSDTQELIEMHGQSWLDAYPNEEHGVPLEYVQNKIEQRAGKEGVEKRSGYIREARLNPDYYLRIARNGSGKLVGFVDARRGEAENELCGLYIDKSEYGKGLAQQLCDGAMRWLSDGKDTRLTVVTYNGRAQAFYRKLGFEVIPGTEHIHNGEVIPVVDMILKGEK